jgi:tRNA U34 5-methylaminomethyl-2-thiouridine-forming methyltransferase MnmC
LPALAADPPLRPPLRPRSGRDGSFSLFSDTFSEGFHCAEGALAEARATFVLPSELERFALGATLTMVEVAVGTGTNTAALLEACRARGLALRWWGLELDPQPLQMALAAPDFRRAWAPAVLAELERLGSGPTLLWGDARARLADLPPELLGACDLVWLDAFSPRRCPQLWTQEFLKDLARLLVPRGRLVSYGSAAAFRASLRALGLQVAAIRSVPRGLAVPQGLAGDPQAVASGGDSMRKERWSGGTVASPSPLPIDAALRPLTAMEEEHLRTRAAAQYHDPQGSATAAEILAERARRQGLAGGESTSAWRRRWGLEGPLAPPMGPPGEAR